MQGKILVIDAVSTNRIVLKVKLGAAFYEVLQAASIGDAAKVLASELPDLIISAVSLPDGTAADLCAALRTRPDTANIPVLAIGQATEAATRFATLAAGAFDVMDRPLDDLLLLGRVRGMIRSHNALEEWRMRDETPCPEGMAEPVADFAPPGRITLVGDDPTQLRGWAKNLTPHLRGKFALTLLKDAMANLHAGSPADVVVLSLPTAPKEAEVFLRLISTLRASAQTRQIGLLVIQQTPDPLWATQALDLGADDLMLGGFDAPELALRLRVLLRRKRQIERMHQSVRTGLRDAINDPLTGLYNRRYAMPHLENVVARAATTHRPYAAIIADMDHFKRINDLYGHAAGDAVLVEAARRLRGAVRSVDMVARLGGEEFLIVMPGTDLETAQSNARTLCKTIGDTPFAIPGVDRPVGITVSIGLALGGCSATASRAGPQHGRTETVQNLLCRADKALYAAKTKGRNRFDLSQPEKRPAA
ncbi:diguanylate cyclase [uncultured Sulfitobacter sp.]|uniref:diguanylate cyclase n=1 Tax=uncultured Sulfitobacter sp. TaxID=191468 RepID=UPI00261FC4BB|nr:diguanylate cyclase [uncultured Sulfitobacter sp.]